MANKQQQLAIQKQISSHMNKNQLAQIPSFSDYKDESNSFSMSKNLTDRPQVNAPLTQSPSSSTWKDAADAFAMLIDMTNKSQEPYSSEVPSPRLLSADSEVWLPKKMKPPSSDQPFPKQQTANSEAWLGTSKTIMQAPTKNPNQWRAPPTSGEDHMGRGCFRPHHFFEHEPSSSEQLQPKRPTPESEAWLRPKNPIMQDPVKNPNQRPCQIMQAPTKNANQRYATPTSGEDQGGCGGLRPHQSFEFEPSSSVQQFPKRSMPNFEVMQAPRKPDPKPSSSEQQLPKRPAANYEAWSGPRKWETSWSVQPFPKRPTANTQAWLRARNPILFPSQTPNQRRETPPRNAQPNSNSRPTNNLPSPNSRPTNTSPPKLNPSVKRKAPDSIDPKYRPAPQPSVEYITNIIKRRSANDYFCDLCQVNSSSALTLRQHLKGRKHRNNAKYCRQNNICREGMRGIHTSGIHRCNVCHISCTDRRSLTMHLKGKQHLERLRKVEHGEVGVQKLIRCELCMVNCVNEDCFDAHIHGKQHAVQLELASRRLI